MIGIHTDDKWLNDAADNLQCNIGSLRFIYLGLPIRGNSSQCNTWEAIINRISKKTSNMVQETAILWRENHSHEVLSVKLGYVLHVFIPGSKVHH